jgi:hypothetical protein
MSVILGFQSLFANKLPSRHDANIHWKLVMLNRQKVQTNKSQTTRNSPTRALQIAD